jgi:hypothetical protein
MQSTDKYNFKSYQIRAANAQNAAEKAAINAELKEVYANLPEAEKTAFNAALQVFLQAEAQRLNDHYGAIANSKNN